MPKDRKNKQRWGAQNRAARKSGIFAAEVWEGANKSWNFGKVIRNASSTLPAGQARRLRRAARQWKRDTGRTGRK